MNTRTRRSSAHRRRDASAEGIVRHPWRVAVGLLLLALASLPPAARFVIGQDESTPSAKEAPAPPQALPAATVARLITIPLPLSTGAQGDAAIDQVTTAVERLPRQGTTRPLLILEFLSAEGTAGEGTEFEAALKLARLLTSDKVSGVRTVAFLPRSVKGHGVLPVIACDEIVMSGEAEFGAAGIEESEIGPVLRASYEDIADRRRTVPKPLALAMLDRKLKLLKVQTLEGSRVVLDSELAELKNSTTVSAEKTIKPEGDLGVFTVLCCG
jgi:membrane-bound serine protease (ClpP class)